MYCSKFNLTEPDGHCAAGFYCQSGSDTPTPQLSNHTGIGGPCPHGSYCPYNTSHPKPCPPGRYGNGTHKKKAEDCRLCEPGYYCDKEGLTDVGGECAKGFFCLNGSQYEKPPQQTDTGGPCTLGHYCENGTSLPLECDAGTYNNQTGQSACKPCCEGFYCDKGSITCTEECPVGHYCPQGTASLTQYPCPPGTFNNVSGRSDPSDCRPCLAGQYCPRSGASRPHGDCDAGWWCRGGASSPQPVDLGNSTDDGQCICSNITTGGKCEAGTFCPSGSTKPTPCSPGTCIFLLLRQFVSN